MALTWAGPGLSKLTVTVNMPFNLSVLAEML